MWVPEQEEVQAMVYWKKMLESGSEIPPKRCIEGSLVGCLGQLLDAVGGLQQLHHHHCQRELAMMGEILRQTDDFQDPVGDHRVQGLVVGKKIA